METKYMGTASGQAHVLGFPGKKRNHEALGVGADRRSLDKAPQGGKL
jgi:hypothetical protein